MNELVDAILIHSPTTVRAEACIRSFHAMDKIGYGMLHIANFLSESGYSVQVWNVPELYRQGYDEKYLKGLLLRGSPILVGIELNWMHQSLGAIEMARMIKRLSPETPVLVGGTHATILAEEIVNKYSSYIDGVLRGEAELSFADCLRRIESGKSIEDVSGLTTRSGGRMIVNPVARIIENLDEVPPYSLKKRNPEVVGTPDPELYAPAINTCRGPCFMECVYCIGPKVAELSGRKEYSIHSPSWIVDQLRLLLDEGYSEFYIQDWAYLSNKKTIESIADALVKEGLNDRMRHVNLVSAPGFLDRDVIRKLSKAGVDTIDYGVETGSQRVLDALKRKIDIQKVKDSVKVTAEEGVIPQTWWMTGFPYETWEDVRETAKLIKETLELGSLPFWVTPLIVEPGTELFEKAERYGLRLRMRSFEDYTVFSRTPLRPNAWYPELVTHETTNFSVKDILKASFLLRMLIYRRRDYILSRLMKVHDKFKSEEVIMHIRQATERILFTIF